MKNKYNSIKLIKSFQIRSVFFRYWIKITLLMLLPFVIITGIICFSFYNTSYDEVVHKIESSATESVNYAKATLQRIDEYTESISLNSACQHFLYLDDVTTPDLNDINSLDSLRRHLHVQQISSSNVILSAFVYSFQNDYILSNNESDFYKNFKYKNWYSYYESTRRQKFIIPSETGSLLVCQLIGTTSTPTGFVVYEISPLRLFNPNTNPIIDNFDFTILNEYDDCVFSTTEQNLAEIYNTLSTEKQCFQNQALNNKTDRNIVYAKADIHAGALYMSINLNDFINKSSLITTIVMLVFLLIILIPLLISSLISLLFYKELFGIMQKLSPMKNVYDVTKNENNEIAFIINNIAKMQEDNTLLRETMLKKMEDLKQLQATVLQLQLNPHFLFNTLNSINIVIMNIVGYKNLASTMIIHLSQLLRIALDTNNYIVSFEDEINYSKTYIQIEEIKSKNKFDTLWEVDNSLLTCKTPKLIMQPIIENAFTHGIKYLSSDTKGLLKITIKEQNEIVVISVTNNGPQIPSDKLNILNTNLKNGLADNPNHVGLSNVNRRIQLLFGKDYGCFVRSNSEKTTVEITIPKILNFIDNNTEGRQTNGTLH